MKKTILTLIIVAILACSVLLLTACDSSLFPVNEERANKQVTATAQYNGREAIVGVGELYNSFYSYYSYLYTYYSYGYISQAQFQSYLSDLDTTFDNTNQSLAKSALYTLKCIDYMSTLYTQQLGEGSDAVKKMKEASTVGKTYKYGNMDQLQQYYADRIAEILAILACHADYKYYNEAVRSANKDLQSLLDDYISTIRSEYEGLNAEQFEVPDSIEGIRIVSRPYRLVYEVGDKSLDTTGLKVEADLGEDKTLEIPVKELVIEGFDSESAAEKQTITITFKDKTATFTVDIVAARPSRSTPAKEDAEEALDNTTPLVRFSFDVKEEDYLNDANGQRLTGDALTEARQEYKIARNAMARLNTYLETNHRTYDDYLYGYCVTQIKTLTQDTLAKEITVTQADIEAEYARLIDEKKIELSNTKYTKSQLDNLSTAYLQPTPADGSYGYYYVSQVLFKFTDATNEKIDAFKAMGANETKLQEYKNKVAEEIEVWLSNPDYDADAECDKESCICPHCKNYTGDPVYYETLEQWYSCVDGCDCAACPSKKYLGTTTTNVLTVINDIAAAIDAVNAQYADHNSVEYRKALLDTINQWIYKANEDDGAFSAITDKKYGYVMTPPTEESGMVATFEQVCDLLAEYNGTVYDADDKLDWAKDGVHVLSAQGGVGSYGWCVSTYGIHFVVLTAYAMEPAYGTVENTTIDGTAYQQMGLDYITNVYDYDDSATETPAVGTVKYDVYKSLIDEKVSANYAKFQKDFINTNAEDHITYNADGYKYLLDKIRGDN